MRVREHSAETGKEVKGPTLPPSSQSSLLHVCPAEEEDSSSPLLLTGGAINTNFWTGTKTETKEKKDAETSRRRLKDGRVCSIRQQQPIRHQHVSTGCAQLDPPAAGPFQRPSEVPSSGCFLLSVLCTGPDGEERHARGVRSGPPTGHGGGSKEAHPDHAAPPEPTQHHATCPTLRTTPRSTQTSCWPRGRRWQRADQWRERRGARVGGANTRGQHEQSNKTWRSGWSRRQERSSGNIRDHHFC